MSDWSNYQKHVAAFFRSLGLEAQVDSHLHGARGEHDIDVTVRFRQFGIDVLWIVECKLWKTAVPKEKIVALQQIAQDVGADRAFLVAEEGFQPGAIRAARFSSITLTSLQDLSENAKEVAATAQLSGASQMFTNLDHRVGLWFTDSIDAPGPRPGVDFDRIVELSGRLVILKMNWAKAVAGQFPVATDNNGEPGFAKDLPSFIAQVTQLVQAVEKELAEIETAAEQTRQEAMKIGEDFAERIEALLVSGRAAVLEPYANEEAKDSVLQRAYVDMKRIGDVLDVVGAILSGKPRQKYLQLRPLLINGIYAHLIDSHLTAAVWTKTEVQVRQLLAEFRASLKLPLHRLD